MKAVLHVDLVEFHAFIMQDTFLNGPNHDTLIRRKTALMTAMHNVTLGIFV